MGERRLLALGPLQSAEAAAAAAEAEAEAEAAAAAAAAGGGGAMRPRRPALRMDAWGRSVQPSARAHADPFAAKLADGLALVARHAEAARTPPPAHAHAQAACGCDCVRWAPMARDYCARTTLHGLRYVGDRQLHVAERAFWLLVFLVAVVAAVYYILFLYAKWKENPVIVSLSPYATQVTAIPFPAVTVCNMNRAKKSVASAVLQQGRSDATEYNLLGDLCDMDSTKGEDRNSSTSWDIVQNFLVKVGQPCHEMIQACRYGGAALRCSEAFNPTITDEGICCSFNKVQRDFLFRNPRDLSDLNVSFPGPQTDWTPEGGFPAGSATAASPLRPVGAGSHLGLSLVLDAQLHEYFCSSTAGTGFKILLHSPVEAPKVAFLAVAAAPGRELRVAVRPLLSFATPQLRALPLAKRRCLFADERPLRFYRTYTQRNCALECEANFTLRTCKCVLPYMPKDTKTPICGRNEEVCAENARQAMEMKIEYPEAFSKMFTNKPNCNCLPGCTEVNYKTSISSSILAPQYSFSKDFIGNINDTYFRNDVTVVHVYFLESQYNSYLKGELFGFTEFLSSTGGLLGLFMGFSFMSLIEIFYYVTLRLWCTIHNRRNLQLGPQREGREHPFALYPFTK